MNMKESVTKFDFEAAFKALDDLEVPAAEKGIKANRPALTEIFTRKSKLEALMEDYYDINDSSELEAAKEDREAEVAKAKLARIEKIVDLDADSPEDLLTSYVGKYIVQCPQCMTLFYKNPEDVVESEDDPTIVNVSEVCQHCGNESGYTLVGKVGEATADDAEPATDDIPMDEEEFTVEDTAEDSMEEPTEDEDLGDFDLTALNLDEEPVEDEEKKEESFTAHTGEALVEDIQDDKELDAKLEAHSEYVEYLRTAIAHEEAELEKTDNEQVKAAIQRRIDAFTADLENALPEEVKMDMSIEEPVEEDTTDEMPAEEDVAIEESLKETFETEANVLTEALKEDTDLDVSATEFEELINSPEFKKPISDRAARAMMNTEKSAENEDDVKESFQDADSEALTEGGLGAIGKAFSKKIAQKAPKVKTREEKADWILANALKDYDNLEFDSDGDVDTAESNKRFNSFIIVGYKDKYSNGKDITAAPSYNNKDLVFGMNRPEVKDNYKAADSIAKGWSMRQGNGPAFIYMAKDTKDTNAVFLCQYYEGALDSASDQLEAYFKKVLNDLQGRQLQIDGGMDQSTFKNITATEAAPGMQMQIDENETAEIIETGKSRLGKNNISIKVKLSDGTEEAIHVGSNTTIKVLKEALNTLNVFVESVDDIQEDVLENFIASYLIESYKNVAGFRLTGCEYLDENFNVAGTIYFTSGNTRKTTYSFKEALIEDNKTTLYGLNEKLGLDKQFAITGSITNKTFITESFELKQK